MKRLPAALLLVIGVALMVVGIGSATWWKPSTTIVANTASDSESGIIATDAGVLELVNDTVRVSARAQGTTVEMVVASSATAALWLGEEPHVIVNGLEDWQTLATTLPDPDVAPDGELSLQGSDLFNPENFISGEDAAELYFTVPEGDWTLIALGQDGTTPELTITWERDVSTPWAIPLVIVGIVLLAAGSALFLFQSQQKTVQKRRRESVERSERMGRADSTDTTVIPAITTTSKADEDADGATCSQVRGSVREETGGSYGASILPASPRAEQFRAEGTETDTVEAEKNSDSDSTDSESVDTDSVEAGDADAVVAEDMADDVTADGGTADEDSVSGDATADGESVDGADETDAEFVTTAESGAEDSNESFVDDVNESLEGTEGNLDGDWVDDASDEPHVGESDDEESSDSLRKQNSGTQADSAAQSDNDERGSSDDWRSLWGFGPKE